MNSNISEEMIREAIGQFQVEGQPVSFRHYGNGHINDTFLLCCDRRYILQRINTEVFSDPVSLMNNIDSVTSFLRKEIIKRNGDPDRETLNLVRTKEDAPFYKDSTGGYWRIYHFIPDASCEDQADNPEIFRRAGKIVGEFQQGLSAFPAEKLSVTIPHFHDTPKRYRDFLRAVNEDSCHRAGIASSEIEFMTEHEKICRKADDMLKEGSLPLRVTHNDTKLNNIMFDRKTGQALCLIDLDTVMPGLSIFDFGDAIRFGANTAAEDETDLSRVSLSIPLFEAYAEGFLSGCGRSLTDAEISMLPEGALTMTLECGMRFLTDFLSGDRYFHIARENHNLDRCRTQFRLAADMEEKMEKMKNIVRTFTA